jgi:hypothetical protein
MEKSKKPMASYIMDSRNGCWRHSKKPSTLGQRTALCAMEFTYNTKHNNSRDPLFLVHGVEAVLPVEITYESMRVSGYDEDASTTALQDDVDALDEARDIGFSRFMQYQQNLRNYLNRQVCPRSFEVRDLVF